MEGGWFSTRVSRRSAACTCFPLLQQVHRWRAACFQDVVLALAPRASVLKVSFASRVQVEVRRMAFGR
eukprot:3709656-Pyramimonas_sp.AAC.1